MSRRLIQTDIPDEAWEWKRPYKYKPVLAQLRIPDSYQPARSARSILHGFNPPSNYRHRGPRRARRRYPRRNPNSQPWYRYPERNYAVPSPAVYRRAAFFRPYRREGTPLHPTIQAAQNRHDRARRLRMNEEAADRQRDRELYQLEGYL